jgi:phosphatidate cytidylyltransferase
MSTTVFIIFSIAASLLIATIIFYIVKRNNPDKDFTDFTHRVKTWWGMWVVFSFATLFTPTVSLVSLMILCFFSLKEFFAMMRTRKADRQVFLWAYLAIPLQFYWIYTGWYGMFIVFIPIYVFLFLPLPRIFSKGTIGVLRSISSTQWGLMLMVFGLSHIAYYQIASPEYGGNLVLYLVLLTQVSDVVQYMVSHFLGRRKIIPTSNPMITWEGFLSSVIVTTMVSFLIYSNLTPLDGTFAIFSGILISFAGFFGSLTVSVVKRDLYLGENEKAEGIQKGYLSRIDSLTYTAPLFFHATRYFFDFM